MATPWGTVDDQKVFQFSLQGSRGFEVLVSNYGATITAIRHANAQGEIQNIVLGYERLEDYFDCPYYGCVVGRYANRIAKGRFALPSCGTPFELAVNNGPNALHGGLKGFDKKVWAVDGSTSAHAVTFKLVSEDGEEGYPGTLTVEVHYEVPRDKEELQISYSAYVTRSETVINLTNHSYFNLSGVVKSIMNHTIVLNSDLYVPVDDTSIPTGAILPVAQTRFDFRAGKRMGHDDDEGYDHTFVCRSASLQEPIAIVTYGGRQMRVFTTEPGVQFYTGNFLDTKEHPKQCGFCLETQHFPDSPNRPHFPSTLLRPGETFSSQTTYSFFLV
eukprot:GEMP01064239.1.p1 GENE.GEMP01064239.1~~GEMP01064239.1.p1  ORF type:complete len:330 (+),score=70.92 GEMP01064239.1:226-1215(+)